MSQPLVSVLIPVFNAGACLRPAVESILNQTHPHLEIIVIDDGSTDGCLNHIADLKDGRLRLLSQANAGKSVALNRALEVISGEFYAIQDADDLSSSRRIERQVNALREHPELAAVFTGYDLIIDDHRMAPRFAAKNIENCRRDIEQMRMPSHDPTVMYRVSCVKGMCYEPALRIGQGLDYILRVGEQFPMMVLGECLYSYRIHFGSNTRQQAERRRQMVRRVLERAAERRCLQLPHDVGNGAVSTREDREHGVVTQFMESVLDLRRSGQPCKALRTAFDCARLHPFAPSHYKAFAYSIAPLSLIHLFRNRK